MNLKEHIKNRRVEISVYIMMVIFIGTLLFIFRVNRALIWIVVFTMIFCMFVIVFYDYLRKKSFYQNYCTLLDELEPKYLICEMIHEPNFYEGKILYQSLYQINKSMIERMNELEESINEFKDYVEMWIHEVKIPLSRLTLAVHNHQSEASPMIVNQVHKLENQVDLILYYVRGQTAQKDYLIKKVPLSQVVKNVVKKNKDYFIYHKVKVVLGDLDKDVYTDSKWLEFILNQILNNSFQYSNQQPVIRIFATVEHHHTILSILDNGIGISPSDLPRVFEKSFTGSNGRIHQTSTGMGLYICSKLCQQLGHHIEIESKLHQYTKVSIVFYDDHHYEVYQ